MCVVCACVCICVMYVCICLCMCVCNVFVTSTTAGGILVEAHKIAGHVVLISYQSINSLLFVLISVYGIAFSSNLKRNS